MGVQAILDQDPITAPRPQTVALRHWFMPTTTRSATST